VIDLQTGNKQLKEQLAAGEMLNKILIAKITELIRKVEELTRKLNENSSNSQKPPSSDSLSERRKFRKKKKPTGYNRGGQPGHQGSYRQLLPEKQVDEIINLFPHKCDMCLEVPPQIIHSEPIRQQVVDLLANGCRHTIEYRRHFVKCHCGEIVVASEDEVPSGSFGPRLSTVVCILTGVYHISRRQVTMLLKEIFGISMSLGSVSNIEGRMTKALAAASKEAIEKVELASVKNIDETSWIRNSDRSSVWVFASLLATVFRITTGGSRRELRHHFTRKRGILISDRATVFLYWPMNCRQVCWSHLSRTFMGFSQRDGPAMSIGQELVGYADLVFSYWHNYKSGQLSKERFVAWITAVRKSMKLCLERAVAANLAEVSGSCANMLEHWDAMWTFIATPGVELTNNHAERELRRIVIWRKRCFGTQSDRGDRYVERIMTVAHTIRKNSGQLLDFLHQSFMAMLDSTPAPPLFAAI